MFLLDIVKNQLEYEKLPYSQLTQIGKKFGFEVKTLAYQFNDWQSFHNWYNEITDESYLYDGKYIEGFVVEDSVGYMVKFKGYYYHLWKHMRSVAQEVFRSGQYRRMGSLLTPLENKFYGFCKEIREQDHPTHIIALRDMFMQRLIESK